MKPVPFAYVAPKTLAEAIAALADHGGTARPLAGGQSLVPMLALRIARPTLLVDLNRIQGLAGISEHGGEIRIGAMTRQAELFASPLIARRVPLLVRALAQVGHPPTRARGTIGGSLSHADPAAELPAVMLAEDASFVLQGAARERVVPASDFFHGMFETAIADSELLTEIRIPAASKAGTGFLEISRRKGDFAIVLAAAKIELDQGGHCVNVRIVLGAVAPSPQRCRDVEDRLIGQRPDHDVLAKAVEALPTAIIELGSEGASRAYRQAVAPVVLHRALTSAADAARFAA
jgi:aerobic carbon-monoxide dehydrogenase medium subunit